MFFVELRFDDCFGHHIVRSRGYPSFNMCNHFVSTCVENYAIEKGSFTIVKYNEETSDFVVQGVFNI